MSPGIFLQKGNQAFLSGFYLSNWVDKTGLNLNIPFA
jgi:hypothetical protein